MLVTCLGIFVLTTVIWKEFFTRVCCLFVNTQTSFHNFLALREFRPQGKILTEVRETIPKPWVHFALRKGNR